MAEETVEIALPCDFHCHFRDDWRMRAVGPLSMQDFGYVLAMPNTDLLILSAWDAHVYRVILWAIARQYGYKHFQPLVTIKATHQTTPEMVREAHTAGVSAIKFYPISTTGEGGTTNAAGGVHDFFAPEIAAIFEAARNVGMMCSFHCEIPYGHDDLDKEGAFIPTIRRIVDGFPGFKIVVEHISDSRMVDFVESAPETVFGTITPHHLMLTCEASVGDPHHMCYPVLKTHADRDALRAAATSGNPKFFFGSDNAPHPVRAKIDSGVRGVFNAPVAIPVVVGLFEAACALDRLDGFMRDFGCRAYGLPPIHGKVKLIKKPWIVPPVYDRVVPMMHGQQIEWQIVR